MQRMGQTVGLDRRRGGQQALRGHLAPEERLARAVVGIAPTEQVAVDPLQGEERSQIPRQLEVGHGAPDPPATTMRCARTHSAHVSIRRQNSSRVPAKLCMCAIFGQTK